MWFPCRREAGGKPDLKWECMAAEFNDECPVQLRSLAETLAKFTWRRFASGLHEPLAVMVAKGGIIEVATKNGVADELYIRIEILDPQQKKMKAGQIEMPTYRGVLGEQQIESLVLYIKSLSGRQIPRDGE